MSDVKQSEPKIRGYVVVALITAGVVYFLTAQNKTAEAIPVNSSSNPPTMFSSETPAPAPQPDPIIATPPPPKPVHFYDSRDGSTYYYAKGVSEEEQKTGKRAPDMIAFWYLGRNSHGLDLLQNVTSSRTGGISACARPCKVIHQDDGTTVGFDAGSIIGAAFADAQNGFSRKHLFPKPTPEADYPWPSASASPTPETPN